MSKIYKTTVKSFRVIIFNVWYSQRVSNAVGESFKVRKTLFIFIKRGGNVPNISKTESRPIMVFPLSLDTSRDLPMLIGSHLKSVEQLLISSEKGGKGSLKSNLGDRCLFSHPSCFTCSQGLGDHTPIQ